MSTNTREAGLEALIIENLIVLNKYEQGQNSDYSREYAVDLTCLLRFIEKTQPEAFSRLRLNEDSVKRKTFLDRLQGEITKNGIVHVLRNGFNCYPEQVILFYGTPSKENKTAAEKYTQNIFSVTRQLHYSQDETKLSLDLCVFINGLPIATFELKNKFTKQTVYDAVEQYKLDRNPRELLFSFGRCMVHFAVDDHEVMFCTALKGKASWFLPFNKGYNDGAGNPPNPDGVQTDYLWKKIFKKDEITNIIENYAQIVEEKDEETKKVTREQIFPRYHQLDVVKKILKDVTENRAGKRYLIQHSAGSGKSNSIAWLAHQMVDLKKDNEYIFNSIIIVTDRINLDKQIKDTIKQFAQVSSIIGHAEGSGDLRKFIENGKKIIITTVQKFPFVLDDIGSQHRTSKFAIIIDEAHSSQGGRTAAKMNMTLAEEPAEYESGNVEDTTEDKINRIIEARKMLKNASYFAFTATPKNKTLEMFGEAYKEGDVVKHRPFHSYTMKQAIQEGFILDVLKYYTPIESYYKLASIIEDDPLFDKKKAQKKLRKFVESNEYAINRKTEIMCGHFAAQVIGHYKIGGQARAMVITNGIERAIQYYYSVKNYLAQTKSPYKPIVAFSGSHAYEGKELTEAIINEFPSRDIAAKFKKDPYRFLIVADKFQTGYDEPLLHTMYVDKTLTDIKAVQTLSRLNRAHPQKHDTFVLDFANDTETIKAAFDKYYRTTILSAETDPNKIYDLASDIIKYQVFIQYHIDQFVDLYLNDAGRDKLDLILDVCVAEYKENLDEDGQVDFKSKAKMFVRAYNFLSAILPYGSADWEKLSTFLSFLLPKLPAPVEEDFSKGILEAIDMDSYRAEVKATMAIVLKDTNAEVDPVPTSAGGSKPVPELEKLNDIIKVFNDLFGNIDWKNADQVRNMIVSIPATVSRDKVYQNAMKNSDKQNAKIENDRAVRRVVADMLNDNTELFKQFADNQSFRKWLTDMVFDLTYNTRGEEFNGQANL